MSLMGLGVVPVDPKLEEVSNVFISAFNIPSKPFLLTLGVCKILGCASLWNIGPMPEGFARRGLITSTVCAAIGHYIVGDSILPPLAFLGMWAFYYNLDGADKNDKIE